MKNNAAATLTLPSLVYIYIYTNTPIKHTTSKPITKTPHKPKKVFIHTNNYIHKIKPNITHKEPLAQHTKQKTIIVYVYTSKTKNHTINKTYLPLKRQITKNNNQKHIQKLTTYNNNQQNHLTRSHTHKTQKQNNKHNSTNLTQNTQPNIAQYTNETRIIKTQTKLIGARPTGLAHIISTHNMTNVKIDKKVKLKTTYNNHMIYIPPLQSGDMEPNPSPTPNSSTKHPPPHKHNKQNILTPYKSKTPPNYHHLVGKNSPTLKTTHPRHQEITIAYPHLSTYTLIHQHHPTPKTPHTSITTINQSRIICNHQPSKPSKLHRSTYLLNKMATIRNPPKRYIITLRTYTLITNKKINIINSPNIIYKRTYYYVQHSEQPNIHTPTNESPSPPTRHKTETLTKNNTTSHYFHPLPTINTPLTIPHKINTTYQYIYITTWNAPTLNTGQTPNQKINPQQHTQQLKLYHKHHTYLTNLSKPIRLKKKSHHTHITKTLITNIPTIKPTQTNLTKLTGARPTGLAHKKEIKFLNIKYHKNKKLYTSHTIHPRPNPPLTTNPHNKSNNYKTKKTTYISKNIQKTPNPHYNNKTPLPIQKQSKYHKQKKLKITQKKHKGHLLLLRGGDIETNPGPMPNILTKHPPSHKLRNKIYFISCTIKLQPEYQHLAKEFSPLLKTMHPSHLDSTITYPHLSRYIYLHQHHPPPRILYALITTLSPSLATCNHQLIQAPNPDWTTSLLNKMATLPNPPERHILTPHPYIQFRNTNPNLINPTNTIHHELYNYVQQNEHTNLQTLTNKFPFLPIKLLTEVLNHNTPLTEYSHPPYTQHSHNQSTCYPNNMPRHTHHYLERLLIKYRPPQPR